MKRIKPEDEMEAKKKHASLLEDWKEDESKE